MTIAVPTSNGLAGAAQTPQRLRPMAQVPAPIDLDDIQGDVLIGLQKNAQRFVFFTIDDPTVFKRALRDIILPKVTSCADAHRREDELRDLKAARVGLPAEGGRRPLIEMCGLNVAFTIHGLQKLLPPEKVAPLPAVFTRAASEVATTCGDPLDANGMFWDPGFPRDGIDGVLNFAGSSRETVDEDWAAMKRQLRGVVTEVWEDGAVGDVRPDHQRGREHFGWRDGVSQPAVKGLAVPYPGQAEIDAGAFVIGAPGGAEPAAGLDWTANGSFMVFRKLEQDVQAFRTFVASEADGLQMDRPLLAARMMGRWPSGAPLALCPLADDPAIGADPMLADDFDHADDPYQRRCPYGAHTRKMNARSGQMPGAAPSPGPIGGIGNQRVMRQGIPYGTEFADDPTGRRGLLFVCYQADIATQFEKQQHDWANDSDFPPNAVRPPNSPRMGQPVRSGLDPIIGQPGQPNQPVFSQYAQPGSMAQPAVGMDEAVPNYPTGSVLTGLPVGTAQTFVKALATLYLFAPSRTAMALRLSA